MKRKIITPILLVTILTLCGCLSAGKMVHPGRAESHITPTPIIEGQTGQHGTDQAAHSVRQAPVVQPAYNQNAKASYQFVKDYPRDQDLGVKGVVTNMNQPQVEFSENGAMGDEPAYQVERNTNPNVRPYEGPLHLGEPGASASLWRTSGNASVLYHDHRAFRPMDIITIVVREDSKGTKKADTTTTKDSSL